MYLIWRMLFENNKKYKMKLKANEHNIVNIPSKIIRIYSKHHSRL